MALTAISPRPDAIPAPVARAATTSESVMTQEIPSSLTFTIGTATPMSRLSVAPMAPDMTSVSEVSTMLA